MNKYFQEKVLAASLDEGKVICEMNEKDFYLYYFLKTFPGKTLVSFVHDTVN